MLLLSKSFGGQWAVEVQCHSEIPDSFAWAYKLLIALRLCFFLIDPIGPLSSSAMREYYHVL